MWVNSRLMLTTMAIKSQTYGDVVITSIKDSKNPEWAWVGFEQEVTTTYEGANDGSSRGLGLMSILDPTATEVVGRRKCFENVKKATLESAGLGEGSVIAGVQITSYAHQIPVKDGMAAGANGKFYTTKITTRGSALSVEVPLSESEAEYKRWKDAVSEVAVSAPATAQPNALIAD